MNPIFPAVGRLLLIGVSALGLATVVNQANYDAHWRAIARSQTIDVNVLTHTLPTKLSAAMIAGRYAEIQRTLDSNQGSIGLLVTDCRIAEWECPSQQIIYRNAATSTTVNGEWLRSLRVDELRYYPFGLLRDPLPVETEVSYSGLDDSGLGDSAADPKWQWTGQRNPGTVVGRVYFIRSSPPGFWSDYQRWLRMPFNVSGLARSYALTTGAALLGGLGVWALLEYALWRRYAHARLEDHHQRESSRQVHRLAQHLQGQQQHDAQRLNDQGTLLTTLQRYQQDEGDRLQRLQLQWATHQGEENTEDAIAFLEQEIAHSQHQQQSIREAIRPLLQTKMQLSQTQAQRAAQLSVVNTWHEQSPLDSPDLEPVYRSLLQDTQRQSLSGFERQVLTTLEASPLVQSGAWKILTLVDLSRDRYSLWATLMIVSSSHAIVIEPKDGIGEVYADGPVRQSTWHYRRGANRFVGTVDSSVYRNPFTQIVHLTRALSAQLTRPLWQRKSAIAVHGVIVFPEMSDIVCIGNQLSDRHWVTTCDRLIRLLEKLTDDPLASGTPDEVARAVLKTIARHNPRTS